ncbi:MAG: PEP-utilizing enzyme [Clostridia bacterium]|nr:PEP-utilizing enzyme [Clostridia bacterium]
MIYDLNADFARDIGNKAKFLIQMKNNGFNVPGGFVLSSQIYNDIVNYNGKSKIIKDSLLKLNESNIHETSLEISNVFSDLIIPEQIIAEIAKRIDSKKYAVRSSGAKEDMELFSFAGQYSTFLNISGIDEIVKSIIGCYKSMYNDTNLSYLTNNRINPEDLEMAVIVQEMVNSEKSGIAFTINPLTGDDKEIVVEVAEGLGENIVSGKVKPEKYSYNWFDSKYEYNSDNKLLNQSELHQLMSISLKIQLFFGYPCDIEFAFEAGNLYILQARPISKIMYSKVTDQWTTADFKDGGVSATVCKQYMWSLYEYVWETTLKRFLLETKLFREKELRKLGDMFYGRPYWNLSIAKGAMAKIPGYKEREFDNELGVRITYKGDGRTTRVTPKSIIKIIQVAMAQSKLTAKQNDNVENYKNELLEKYTEYIDMSLNEGVSDDIESIWYKLIKTDYLQSEGTYFWQIFINTIQQPLFKRSLTKYVNSSDYLSLIGGLENVSHLLPFYDIWEISRKIYQDKQSLDFWRNSGTDEIKGYYLDDRKEHCIQDLKAHINKYGYHSERELDVTYPCYFEDVEKVIKMIKDTVALDNSFSPYSDSERQYKNYSMQLENIKKQMSPKKYEKILKKIEKMRSMLWWREELRDISTRFYYIVRIYTIKLAEFYYKKRIIDCVGDIWYLKINDIFEFIDNKKSTNDLKKTIEKNKNYYNSFRNFMSENEIGSVFDNGCVTGESSTNKILGVGCSNGIVTGTARVIENLEEIDKLEVGDILITKFTDTGWTSKFAILKGIVTEYGGILCHAAIVSREYGIPCIVSCSDVTKKIKDGSRITINGTTGEIIIDV